MSVPEKVQIFSQTLPDAEGTKRFFLKLGKKHPKNAEKLLKNEGLLSDILTLAAFSPLLATTILQHPNYLEWLNRERHSSTIKEKEEILESLARFALTNSLLETNVLLARFRRRELLRIYLKDIRRLSTIVEITEEISNLADSILEHALQIARQELDNQYGMPLEVDTKGRSNRANFCVVALGKLGSKELNYSSDIDLLYLYSQNGSTSGHGSKGKTSNRQYFIKLAQTVSKIVGEQTGEGAAYRVDLRLRPNGRVGALSISLTEAVKYYKTSSQMWERQVLIRSRSSAGDSEIFTDFLSQVESNVFSPNETVEHALGNVLKSKEKIDLEKIAKNGFDVKLGKGGIREIEFIAQALQLAYAGTDPWLRSPHTLISLSRLADRKLITEIELTELFEAYEFLRRLEHRLQMEHGLQIHIVADKPEKRLIVAERMNFETIDEFDQALKNHTQNVSKAFKHIFGERYAVMRKEEEKALRSTPKHDRSTTGRLQPILSSLEKSENEAGLDEETLNTLEVFSKISPPFSAMIAAHPKLIKHLPTQKKPFIIRDYSSEISSAVQKAKDFAEQLTILRKLWSRFILEIATEDIFKRKDATQIKTLQTSLAEASIEAAIAVTKQKLTLDCKSEISEFPFAVLGLGKLGSGSMDYGSDIDLVLIYDDKKPSPLPKFTRQEFYAKAAEIFVTVLSSLTRDGSLYRVDLRLRPDGKNGATSIGKKALLNYFETRSAIWEWLAYVKCRGIAGPTELANSTENLARKIIHKNAQIHDPNKTKAETYRIRKLLKKAKGKKGTKLDIKYGEGGLQDVYFAIRYLQLRDDLPDNSDDRSTSFSLSRLKKNKSLSDTNYNNLITGYKFLSALDHALRLTVGRSSQLPVSNKTTLENIASRLKLQSSRELIEKLTIHRLEIHSSFCEILKP